MVKVYSKYQNTRLPWLDKMPDGWQIKRGKAVFRCIDVRSKDGAEELLTVSSKDGVVPRSSKKITMFMAESYEGYKLCWPGDLVINSLWAWMFGLGFSRHHGIVSSAYGVYRPKDQYSDYWKYFDCLFRSNAYDWELRVRSQGIWTSRLQLTDERFLDMPVLIPPKEDVVKIVNFISVVDSHIRYYIKAKQRAIRLLSEQKQAIITKAISRGINPNVQFKSSGVDWLGEVPVHWDVLPLKRLAWFKGGSGFPINFQGNKNFEIPFYKVSDMTLPENELFLRNCNNSVSCEMAKELGAKVFPKDTIVFPKVGGAMLTNKRRITVKPSCIDNNMMGCVITGKVSLEFLFLKLTQIDLGLMSKPGPVPAISEGEVREIRIPFPPDLTEQTEVVNYIKINTASFDKGIALYSRDIELIREYRARIISDVVTGKTDVRDVQLPEIKEEDLKELIDEQEVSEDIENSEEVVNADE
jgi:type I restriction enzyme, S subunit